MIWAFEVDTVAPTSRAGASPRGSRASCCCGRSAAPSTSCRPTSSTDDEFALLAERTREIVDARMSMPGCGPLPRRTAARRWRSRWPSSRRRPTAALPRPVVRRVPRRGRAAQRGRHRRPGGRQATAAVRAAARPSAQPRVGDEARHDLRRAGAARPGLPLEDRGLPRRPARSGRAARQPGPQGQRRPEDHRRAVAGVHGDAARAGARRRRAATSCSTARSSRRSRTIPAAFDGEPQKPYNVGPDALLVNFKSVKFVFAPNAAADAIDVTVEPPLAARQRRPAAAARRRRLRRLARDARRDVRRSRRARGSDVRGTLSGVLRRARVVGLAARPPDVRARHVRHLLPRRGRPLCRRLARTASRPPARRRSRRSSRRRSGTSFATSTSCPTT